MTRILRSFAIALACALFVPCAASSARFQQAAIATDARPALRHRILDLAERYASFEWKASAANVKHGDDGNGTRVDTPDAGFHEGGWKADGSVNRGLPYAWGGFTSLEEFETGLERGLFAGLVPKSERAGASAQALGLDCSGFVARAWDLPVKQSTRSLGGLCYELDSYDELQPGDIANKFDSHVVLFKEWVDPHERTRARVYEAGAWKVMQSEYDVEALRSSGFVPMRYKPLDDRWVPMDTRKPAFSARGAGTWETDPEADAPELSELASPLGDATPLEWARYRVADDAGHTPASSTQTRMVARMAGARASCQTESELLGKALMTGAERSVDSSLVDALLDFAAYSEPLGDMQLVAGSVELGVYELAEREFPARRVSALLEGSRVVRHEAFPVTIELDCVLSPEVGVHGVLEARFVSETVWRTGDDGEPLIARRVLEFELTAFGGPAE